LDEKIPVRFIFDAHLPRVLTRALAQLREPVAHVFDFFPPDASDEEIIAWAGERAICVVSRDTSISRRKHQKSAVLGHAVGMFYLLPGAVSPNRCKIIQTVIKHWPGMKVQSRRRKPFLVAIRERSGISRYDAPRPR
jgi:predicted nuclease of predicted toxin-antitoxin system